MNFIRRKWWLIIIGFILLPIGLNYLLNINVGANIIGEPKDWLTFWGAYISSIVSLWMIILTYLIIKQNDEARQGVVICKVIYHKKSYGLEITNVGNSVAYDINLSTNEEFNNILHELSKKIFIKFQNKKFSLKPNESKYIFIECALEGDHQTFNSNTNQLEVVNNNKEYLEKLKNTTLSIEGTYCSIGKKYEIKESFCIDDFDLNFMAFTTNIDDELPKITKAINGIKWKV